MNFTEYNYDIIVLAGQSNAQGTGRGDVSEEYIPDEDIITLTPSYSIELVKLEDATMRRITYADKPLDFAIADERIQDGKKYGELALTFSSEYKKNGYLKSGRKILIIRAAIGATGFKFGHWGVGKPLYTKLCEMLDYALSLNESNRLCAFLWHQGEQEIGRTYPPEIYRSQLKEMLADLKMRYDCPTLPIIAADFAKEWKLTKEDQGASVIKVIREVIEGEGGIFLPTDDLPTNNHRNGDGDILHFCRESLHILGKRYFEGYEKLIR